MAAREIVILGAGGLAREVAFLIEEINRHAKDSESQVWRLLGFVDQDADKVGTSVGNYQIIATEAEIANRTVDAVIAIGDPARLRAVRGVVSAYPGLAFPNLVHPSVVWDKASVSLGQGNIICAGTVMTVDIKIGSFNILNMNVSVGHDVIIGDCCVIGPGSALGGGVVLGNGCLIGMGSQVYQNRTIGPGATVGLGSAVTADVTPKTTVIGVPARPFFSAGMESPAR